MLLAGVVDVTQLTAGGSAAVVGWWWVAGLVLALIGIGAQLRSLKRSRAVAMRGQWAAAR